MKFPVFRTVLEVLDYCWGERRLLVRFAALPFVLTLILAVAALAFGISQNPQESYGAIAALMIATAMLYLPLTVTWYRITVFGENEAANRPMFTLGRRELRLLGWQVILILIFSGVGVTGAVITSLLVGLDGGASGAFTIIAGVWTIVWVGALLLAVVRLTLVLALVAVDQPVNLKIVWVRTKGMSWRLAACIVLLTLAAVAAGLLFRLVGFIVATLAAMVASAELSAILPYFELLGQNVLSFLSLILNATLFGFIYNMLTARAMSEAQGQPPVPPTASAGITDDLASGTPAPPAPNARIINGVIFLYLWLSYTLKPTIVPEGGDYWAEKAKQLFRFGPFDDIPRLMGQGVFLLPIWFVIHLLLGRMKKKKLAREASTDVPHQP